MAEAAGIGYTDGACCGDKVGNMACFLRERRRGNKGDERRTGPLDEAGVRRSCHQKKKGEGRGNEGVRYGDNGAG